MQNKVIIFSAPSGAGKTTLVKHLLELFPVLEFSISACSREKRPNETNGKDYFFISAEEFKNKIDHQNFIEWEEVYQGCYYGTLRSEIERIWNNGNIVIFDVDVKGGINLKRIFGEKALSIFVSPPNIQVLEQRLRARSTESEESLKKRIDKASLEMQFASQFDKIIVNNELSKTFQEAEQIVKDWINPS